MSHIWIVVAEYHRDRQRRGIHGVLGGDDDGTNTERHGDSRDRLEMSEVRGSVEQRAATIQGNVCSANDASAPSLLLYRCSSSPASREETPT